MLDLMGKVAIVTGAGTVGAGWGNGKATAVLFLAFDEARYITATKLVVDGVHRRFHGFGSFSSHAYRYCRLATRNSTNALRLADAKRPGGNTAYKPVGSGA